MDLIPYSKQSINEEDISLLSKTMSSDFLTQGPKIPEFEKRIQNTLEFASQSYAQVELQHYTLHMQQLV